jgi:cellobiose phosphorylase
VQRDAGIIQLFAPPFNAGPLEPGYIKGYVPGVRENGGQYTHAAVWTLMAFARLGEIPLAWELFDLINPIHHGNSAAGVARYQVEPYVVAADVYSVEPHKGRGGWTWYTGSAGWMYRLILETLLGIVREGDRLRFEPRLRPGWTTVRIRYRYRSTPYNITLVNKAGNGRSVAKIILDGSELAVTYVNLTDDQHPHQVEVHLKGSAIDDGTRIISRAPAPVSNSPSFADA